MDKHSKKSKPPITLEELNKQQEQEFNERKEWLRYLASDMLKQSEAEYIKGNKSALIDALSHCAMARIEMPEWLRVAIEKAIRTVKGHHASSWDDVFGKPHAKGTNLNARRKKKDLEWPIYQSIRLSGRTVDKSLFEDTGRVFNIGATLTAEIYYSKKAFWDSAVEMCGEDLLIDQPIITPQNTEK